MIANLDVIALLEENARLRAELSKAQAKLEPPRAAPPARPQDVPQLGAPGIGRRYERLLHVMGSEWRPVAQIAKLLGANSCTVAADLRALAERDEVERTEGPRCTLWRRRPQPGALRGGR